MAERVTDVYKAYLFDIFSLYITNSFSLPTILPTTKNYRVVSDLTVTPYKSRPYLPTHSLSWLRDTISAPRHSLLTSVISYVRVFLLNEPPVIDGSVSTARSNLFSTIHIKFKHVFVNFRFIF